MQRFLSVDPLADKYPAWNPYHYVHNNPIGLTDPTGMSADSAWTITNSWNKQYIGKFQASVSGMIAQYEKNGNEYTCEDLALSLLIDFAEKNELPIRIGNGSGYYDSRSDNYTDKESFKNDVLTTTGANDLLSNLNTSAIKFNEANSGDIILNVNDKGIAHHTQVIRDINGGVMMNIKQGNSGIMNHILGASRIFGAGNPNSVFYTGKKIESGFYIPSFDYYRNISTNNTIQNYSKKENITFRRFNFKLF